MLLVLWPMCLYTESMISSDLKDYYAKLDEIKKSSLHIFNPDKIDVLKIEVQDKNDAKNIYESLSTDNNFQLQIYDRGFERNQIEDLNKEFRKALLARGTLAGVNLWTITIEQFFDWTKYIVTYELGKWILGHIIQDLDDGIWDKTKGLIKKAFASLIKNKSDLRKNVLVMNIDNDPFKCIIFIFDSSYTSKQFEEKLNKIPVALKSIDMKAKGPFVFESDIAHSEWYDARDKYPMG